MGTMQGIGVIILSMKIKLLFIQLLTCLVLLFRTKIVQHKEQLMFNDLLYFGVLELNFHVKNLIHYSKIHQTFNFLTQLT